MVEARNQIVREEPLGIHGGWEGRGYDLSAAPNEPAGWLESVAGLSSHANTRGVATASGSPGQEPRREPPNIRFEQVLPRAVETTDQASDTATRKLNSTFPNATTSPSLSTAWATR